MVHKLSAIGSVPKATSTIHLDLILKDPITDSRTHTTMHFEKESWLSEVATVVGVLSSCWWKEQEKEV